MIINKIITKEEVEHIANLCRIDLKDEEKLLFLDQFNQILEFFHKLDEVDTSNIKPTFHIIDIKNVFRSDNIKECLSSKLIFDNVPKKEKNFIVAPKMNE